MIRRLLATFGLGTKVELRLESPVPGEVVLYADDTAILWHTDSAVGCRLYVGGKHGTIATAPERWEEISEWRL